MTFPTIIKSKSFHANNLILQLLYDSDFNIYYINIYRDNTNTNHDLFGIYLDLNEAIHKFNSIKL